jgi:hypothetical protein
VVRARFILVVTVFKPVLRGCMAQCRLKRNFIFRPKFKKQFLPEISFSRILLGNQKILGVQENLNFSPWPDKMSGACRMNAEVRIKNEEAGKL